MSSNKLTKDTILKTWMGFTSGGYLGRDDGYPERKFHAFDSLEDAVIGEARKDQQFYRLVPVPREEVFHARAQLEREERSRHKRHLATEIKLLQKEHDEL